LACINRSTFQSVSVPSEIMENLVVHSMSCFFSKTSYEHC
jgi:hypothetical protein